MVQKYRLEKIFKNVWRNNRTNYKLYFGDCLEIMRQIEDQSINMIFADLPYGTTKNAWDKPIELDKLWTQYNRIIKPNGCIALWAQSPYDKSLACSNLAMYRYEWIIKKTRPTGFLNANKMPMKAHENVLIFYKSLPTYNPQKTYGHTRKVSTSRHKRNSKQTENYGNHKLTTYDSTERYPTDVLEFKWDTQIRKDHSTQKPIAACEYFIKTYTNEGDTVLDNTMGSGTTGIACANTKRSFIGIELMEMFYNISKSRIAKAFVENGLECYV